jgi:hypothetical protein
MCNPSQTTAARFPEQTQGIPPDHQGSCVPEAPSDNKYHGKRSRQPSDIRDSVDRSKSHCVRAAHTRIPPSPETQTTSATSSILRPLAMNHDAISEPASIAFFLLFHVTRPASYTHTSFLLLHSILYPTHSMSSIALEHLWILRDTDFQHRSHR